MFDYDKYALDIFLGGKILKIIGCGYSVMKKGIIGTELITVVKRSCEKCPYYPKSIGCRWFRDSNKLKLVYLFSNGHIAAEEVRQKK